MTNSCTSHQVYNFAPFACQLVTSNYSRMDLCGRSTVAGVVCSAALSLIYGTRTFGVPPSVHILTAFSHSCCRTSAALGCHSPSERIYRTWICHHHHQLADRHTPTHHLRSRAAGAPHHQRERAERREQPWDHCVCLCLFTASVFLEGGSKPHIGHPGGPTLHLSGVTLRWTASGRHLEGGMRAVQHHTSRRCICLTIRLDHDVTPPMPSHHQRLNTSSLNLSSPLYQELFRIVGSGDVPTQQRQWLSYTIAASNWNGPTGHGGELPEELWPYVPAATKLKSTRPPSKGVWQAGAVILTDPPTVAHYGWLCEVGGAPGQWKAFGMSAVI